MRMHTHALIQIYTRSQCGRSLSQQIVLAHAKIPSVESLERQKIVDIDKCTYCVGIGAERKSSFPQCVFSSSLRTLLFLPVYSISHNEHAIGEAKFICIQDPKHISTEFCLERKREIASN